MRAVMWAVASLLWAAVGCGSKEASLADARAAVAAAEPGKAEDALRDALSRWPDDVPLLLQASELYLTSDPPGFYKPRLALHYAMRADKAAGYTSADAARAFHRARMATGFGIDPDERAILGDALARVQHPDRFDPQGMAPFAPDELDPSLQAFVDRARARRQRCPDGAEAVPQGAWPLGDVVVDLPAFCLHPAAPALQPADAPVSTCAALGLRACTGDELQVACGPLRSTLAPHPACDGTAWRCCSAPGVARGGRGH